MVKLIVLLFACVIANAGNELPSIVEIIQEEGQFAFTDGSSVFQFFSDGSFLMEPTGLSGRAIEGTWKSLDSGLMEITGIWTWYNGTSAINDQRMMLINISLLSMETEDREQLWQASAARLYDVYFTVEELGSVE
jgi:hypothetical protein